MKNFIILLAFVMSSTISAQYCAFYDFEADEPEMVVSTLKAMMDSDWGKNIQGTKSLFQYSFNGTNGATHSVQFCFQDEAGLEQFMMSFAGSPMTQLLGEKLGKYMTPVSQQLNVPAWYQNDWSNDQVFMIWQMKVTDASKYASTFVPFAKKMMKKMDVKNSFGLGYPILGKTNDFTHFVWSGAPDVKTALARTKTMYADADFAKYSAAVNDIRSVVNTVLMVRVMDF